MMPPQLSRRQFLATTGMAAAAAWSAPRSLFAQETAPNAVVAQGRAMGATAKITTVPLRGGVSTLQGSGGNIVVLPGKDGWVIVDAGYSTSKPQITAALAALSNAPITHLINTHWHYDHTDGNEWMHAAGATILAQENAKARLAKGQPFPMFHVVFPPAPAGAVPTKTFAFGELLKLNGATLSLSHFRPAHTDGDIAIHFVEADVMHLGDTWFNGFYPFIDYSSNGSIDGMIHATDRTLGQVSDTTILVPGHGPVGNKAQLMAYRDVLTTARERVAALKKQGKTLDEIVAAKPLAQFDATWGAGFVKTPMFLDLVYQGV